MGNLKNKSLGSGQSRRKFIETSLMAGGVAALHGLPYLNHLARNKEYTVQQVIDLILKDVPGAPLSQTVDTLKSGSGDSVVTAIVTTMFATIEVIRKAAALNANFIIAHEPTFYNHTDDVNWTGRNNIVSKKQELIGHYGITIWRFHDQWHAHRPDGIMYGVLKKTGWLQYNQSAEKVCSIPSTGLEQIIGHLKTSLNIPYVRMIGDPSSSCKKIALLPGAWGGQNQISLIEKEQPDLVIVGEVHEWETAEYVRDARLLGSPVSLVVLGHAASEEPGMEWLVDWLQPKLEGIRVTHIASGSALVVG